MSAITSNRRKSNIRKIQRTDSDWKIAEKLAMLDKKSIEEDAEALVEILLDKDPNIYVE